MEFPNNTLSTVGKTGKKTQRLRGMDQSLILLAHGDGQ